LSTPAPRKVLTIALCLTLSIAGCSEEKAEPAAPKATEPAPSSEPTYNREGVESSLHNEKSLGKKWRKVELLLVSFKAGKLRGCSDSKITLPGKPIVSRAAFGEPKHRNGGANYAYFTAVYPSTQQASEAMDKIHGEISKCPPEKKIPREQKPGNRFIYEHDNTWKLTEGEILGWRHLRGFEKSVYPPSVGRINVFYFSIDYAQRGNLVFSSIYWKRVEPKDSGDPIAEKATELLTEQLKRFG
jgi:hypothetical protein